jgi:hypothetical protein
MALRWCAASVIGVGKKSRRANGHLRLPEFRDALNACFAENVAAACQDGTVSAA